MNNKEKNPKFRQRKGDENNSRLILGNNASRKTGVGWGGAAPPKYGKKRAANLELCPVKILSKFKAK